MRKIASIGFAIGALTVAALPVHAADQSIGFATGAIGSAAWPAYQQSQSTWRQHSAVRAAPSLQVSPEAYGGYAYGGYAQSDGYAQRNCTYIGGPKSSTSWTCW
jgi:hypothetical protein